MPRRRRNNGGKDKKVTVWVNVNDINVHVEPEDDSSFDMSKVTEAVPPVQDLDQAVQYEPPKYESEGAVGGDDRSIGENSSPDGKVTSGGGNDPVTPPTLLLIGEHVNPNLNRHCAFCLDPIPAVKVLLCGGCERRAYCSKACQVLDWSEDEGQDPLKTGKHPHPRGQVHKEWCGISYGEEDLDWKVAAVGEMGLGIVALRPFAPNTRIMVDPCQMSNRVCHPKTRQLLPSKGSFLDKFRLNSIPCDLHGQVLCLRIARVNHKCLPNAGHVLGKSRVKILYSQREIAAGEEIFINYYDLYRYPNKEYKEKLLVQWGIRCPKDCICWDEGKIEALAQIKELDKLVESSVSEGHCEDAIKYAVEVHCLHQEFGSPWNEVDRTLYDLFQITLMSQTTQLWAKIFIEKLYNLAKDMLHPKSNKMIVYSKWREDFTGHRNYLQLERFGSSRMFKGYEDGSPEHEFEMNTAVINSFPDLQIVQLHSF